MKKGILYIIIALSCLFSTIHLSQAWLWLVGQNGDIINVGKWNEMITKLNLKLEQANIVWSSNIDITTSWTWVIISFTWAITTEPIPYISWPTHVWVWISSSKDIIVNWLNFTPTTTINIPGWPWTINSTTINSPEKITINVTSDATIADYDLVINNGTVPNTFWTWNWVGMIKVLTTWLWKDLRLWGETFTHWNWAWNDIRYKAGMTLARDANWMHFSGVAPWSSWVKFESLWWTRGDTRTIEWIVTQPSSYMMFWIWSDATDENSTAQYNQAEVVTYFQNSTTMWWFYWNNWTIWINWNQSLSTALSGCSSQVFKTKVTNDWTVWSGVFTIYCLPSAWLADWDDETTIIATANLWGTLNPDEANLMPFIIPQSASTQRFIAVRVQ